jgi:hydroxyethylthiazole kinase-like uncharacterized protein yjeF
MLPVVTVAQMRAIDEQAIGKDLTIGYSYMLKAGIGLFLAAREIVPDPAAGDIAVICGRGNNGGDGYVVARLLLEAGYRVMCFCLCGADELRGEARLGYNEYLARKGNLLALDDVNDLSNLSHYRLIIDAMLGTGARGDPRGIYASVIAAINESGVPVVSADTPSGLNNDTGMPGNPCIKASVTVTMGFPKLGLYFYPGRDYVGRLSVQDLGYPDDVLEDHTIALQYPTHEDLAAMLPPRKPAGSKIDHGMALLVCGSRGMAGSATLAARAALRCGCGMTHLAAPESIVAVLSEKLTETVIHPIPETAAGTPALSSHAKISALAASMKALCIGPGISHEDETGSLVRAVVSTVKIPILLDADGINAYKGRPQELASHAGDLVITPHRGEWQRLFGELGNDSEKMIEKVRKKSRELSATIVLKGNPTIAASPDGKVYMLPFGNSGLAKAGSGDVLSGIIVSLLAQGAPAPHAAVLGVYIHGEAGTIASEKLGEYSVIPTDVINTIHKAMRKLCGK